MIKPGTATAQASIVWVTSYLFFLAALANNLSASHDSINYLNHIVKADHLFHQHHLLYHYFANGWLQLLKAILPGVSEHKIVESFTALWGSAALAVCYLFFRRRFGLNVATAAGGVAVIAFSYGTWFYSVNVEVYAPPLFFILACLYLMSRKSLQSNTPLSVGVMHAAAMLFHQVNVLFTVVVIFWLLQRYRNSLIKSASLYFLPAVLFTVATYFFVGYFHEGHQTYTAFADWIMGYTVGHGYWQPLNMQTPLKVVAGFGRAFIGAQFVFQIPAVREFLLSSFLNHALEDEMFLTRNISAGLAWLLVILSAVVMITLIVLAVRFAQNFRKLHELRSTTGLLLLCFFVYSVFFVFWMPDILEFWILQMVITWLLLIGTLPLNQLPVRLGATAFTFLLALIMLVINYAGSIFWLQSFSNDWYYQQTIKLNSSEKDLVIIEDKWILKDYVRYYRHSEVIATDEAVFSRTQINSRIRETLTNGGRVYINKNGWRTIQSY